MAAANAKYFKSNLIHTSLKINQSKIIKVSSKSNSKGSVNKQKINKALS